MGGSYILSQNQKYGEAQQEVRMQSEVVLIAAALVATTIRNYEMTPARKSE
jgi:hypothetical protein